MKYKLYLFALCISACFSKATTEAETVWLTEVTAGLQTDKRGVTSPDFPDQLSFHVKGKTHELVLNLEKNNRIDHNVDTYIVQSTIDGQSLMEKMKSLDKADVAYYQDVDNGAFMTARCVKRLSGQCDILINGNIRLGDRSYNMRPSDAYAIPSDFLELMGLRGKRYVLQDQAPVLSGMSEQNNEETSGVENNVEDKYTDLPRRMPYPYEQDKQNLFIKRDDKARDLNNYYVDVVVVADSGLWDFFLMLADSIGPHDREDRAYAEIKQYVVQFVHGVDGIFRGIEDHSIAISVGLVGFVLLKDVGLFPHEAATVEIQGGISMIDGDKYLQDLQKWDTQVGSTKFESYDQVILLTRHSMKAAVAHSHDSGSRSITGGICDAGRRVSIVHVTDFDKTTRTAAHALGHALGARDDGEYVTSDCRPEHKFLMSPSPPIFKPGFRYGLNPWKFAACSVSAFKEKLVYKRCLRTKHVLDDDILEEFDRILRTPPGVKYSTNQQCVFRNGIGSRYSGRKLDNICSAMTCTDPATDKFNKRYMIAATGTVCGQNKSCHRGMCLANP